MAVRRALEQGFVALSRSGDRGCRVRRHLKSRQGDRRGNNPWAENFLVQRGQYRRRADTTWKGMRRKLWRCRRGVQIRGRAGGRRGKGGRGQQLEHGADWIKGVHDAPVVGGPSRGNLVSQPTLTVEELKAIVDETHGMAEESGVFTRTTELDCSGPLGWRDAIRSSTDWRLRTAQIAQMQRQGTWYCATLSPYYDDWAPADTLEGKRDPAPRGDGA